MGHADLESISGLADHSRAWLGHASLETTNRYAEITLRTKQAALEKCTVPNAADERIPRKPLWRTDAALLSWLQSL